MCYAVYLLSRTLQQHVRGFAKAAGKGGGKAAPAKPAAAAAEQAKDDLSPPEFKIKRVPRVYKGDPVAQLTGPQVCARVHLCDGVVHMYMGGFAQEE